MKYLFIFIIFLGISTPILGKDDGKQNLYKWETSSGIQWKSFGDKDTQDVYEGEVKDNQPNGLGILKGIDGSKYIGEWLEGVYNGKGTLFLYGDKYVGDFKNGKYHGKGLLTTNQGNTFDGEWKEGKFHGKLIMKFKSGSKFDGEWKDGKKHGKGRWIFQIGEVKGHTKVGEWKNDKEWNVRSYDENGKLKFKIVNGVHSSR